MDLTRLTIVYPDKVKDKTTSSVCLVDPVSFEVYVIYVGNYADDYNYYSDNNADGDYNDTNESTFINAWIGYLLILEIGQGIEVFVNKMYKKWNDY